MRAGDRPTGSACNAAAHLTERETDILRALAEGLSNAEIAAQVCADEPGAVGPPQASRSHAGLN